MFVAIVEGDAQSERATWKGSMQEEPARVEDARADWRINMDTLVLVCLQGKMECIVLE